MRIILALPLLAVGLAPSAYARSHVQVGTCEPGVTSLTTIAGAVSAVGAGGTVDVCPGTYAEQVVIGKSLTLKGVSGPNASQAIIVPPSGGVVANASSIDGGSVPIAAQILVQGAAAVAIEDLTVDGANNGIASCATDIMGVLYQNASGVIRSNLVRNQVLSGSGLIGCQSGEGIFVESDSAGTSVLVQSNLVENYQKNGITGNGAGTNLTVSLNNVQGQGPTTGAAENSIQLAFGATGKISGNKVGGDIWAPDAFGDTGNAAAGILVYDSPNVPITANVVASTQYGIVVVGDGSGNADGATVSGNTVAATHLYDGVDICGARNVTVSGNTVSGSDESAIHTDSSCGQVSTGDSVTSNVINGGCAGILEGSGSVPTTVSGNVIINAVSNVVGGSDVCPVPVAARAPFGKQRHASPKRG